MRRITQVDQTTGEELGGFVAVIRPKQKSSFQRHFTMNQAALITIANELNHDQMRVLRALLAELDYENYIQVAQMDIAEVTCSPQINIPIFNAGKLKSELRLAEIRKSGAVISYEQTIQTAFKDVADGLSGLETFGLQIMAQKRAVSSASKRAELSLLRYRAGVDGRLELLDAQRQLYAERQVLIDLRGAELANYVALYKALGGSFLNKAETGVH
jgi:outer membrane protein TolC